jgi:hypothetical protein
MKLSLGVCATALLLGLSPLALAQSPSTHRDAPVAGGGVMSEAQVIQRLESRGYSNVKLTPLQPNALDTRPQEQNNSGSSTPSAHPQDYPAHVGWNGTATRNGRQVNIYVDQQGNVRER